MTIKCKRCLENKAILKRPKTGDAMCKECFYFVFEEEIHKTITDAKLFKPGERIGIGASGGKDSTVLAYVLKVLNERYNYGVELILLSIDEGITGYRDDSLESVKRNQTNYNLQLKVVTYEELYGWTMDEIVKQVGRKNNCTFCGVFRRQALDRGGLLLNVNKIVTGHNADDIAETVLMNILRGDIGRLQRCTSITTGNDGAIPRCKPFKYTYEKEIVMYAYFKKLDYFSTECVYSPNAYRGYARAFIKDLEAIRARSIIDIIHSGEKLAVKKDAKQPVQGICERCGYISSMNLCKACNLLEGLNRGIAKLGIGKTTRLRKQFNLSPSYSLNSSMASLSLKSSQSSLVACNDSNNNNDSECCQKNNLSNNNNNKTGCCGGENNCKSQVNLKNIKELTESDIDGLIKHDKTDNIVKDKNLTLF